MKLHCTKQTLITLLLVFLCPGLLHSQEIRQIHIVETGDVHGAWFDEPYVDGAETRPSLMSVKYYVDSLKAAVGADNVIFVDAGDCLQGDNASYYFNNVADKSKPHLFPRLAKAMGYDAITVGNHDIEAGHEVYDKVLAELATFGIPWLGGNVIRKSDGGTYFPLYRTIKKAGLKVAIIGFENPNIPEWLPEDRYSGMDFLSLVPFAQTLIDLAIKKEHPDAVVVVAHSGTGDGSYDKLESQAMYLFNNLKGVDVLVGGHDHAAAVYTKDGRVYLNSGSRATRVGHAVITVRMSGKTVLSKESTGEIKTLNKNKVDKNLKAQFAKEFNEVKQFTNRKVGNLSTSLYSKDAYFGPCDYVNLIHSVQLGVKEAQLSFAAPLSYNGKVEAGSLVYNDMFTVYPYENELFVVKLKGSEIKAAMEYTYDTWIQTPGDHVLLIENKKNGPSSSSWSFVKQTYNFDSVAGLNYTVDVTKPAGSRINITTLADGTPFDADAYYNVAMTSYRASGGGGSLTEGAGLDAAQIEKRTVAKYPAVRDMVYEYFKNHDVVTSDLISNPRVVGTWKFVPEELVGPLMEKDRDLLF